MTFSLSCLTKLPQTLVLRELALGFRLWGQTNLFLTVASPPQRAEAPSPFRQNILRQFHEGPVFHGPVRAAVLAQLSPSPPPSPHCQERGSQPAPGITGSHCPIPSFLGWAADTSLSFIRSFTPWNQPGSSWKVRGAGGRAVDVRVVQCGAAREPARLFLLSLSIFHCSRWSTSRDPQHKKEITRFGFPVCY